MSNDAWTETGRLDCYMASRVLAVETQDTDWIQWSCDTLLPDQDTYPKGPGREFDHWSCRDEEALLHAITSGLRTVFGTNPYQVFQRLEADTTVWARARALAGQLATTMRHNGRTAPPAARSSAEDRLACGVAGIDGSRVLGQLHAPSGGAWRGGDGWNHPYRRSLYLGCRALAVERQDIDWLQWSCMTLLDDVEIYDDPKQDWIFPDEDMLVDTFSVQPHALVETASWTGFELAEADEGSWARMRRSAALLVARIEQNGRDSPLTRTGPR